jgi:hypothetical protein
MVLLKLVIAMADRKSFDSYIRRLHHSMSWIRMISIDNHMLWKQLFLAFLTVTKKKKARED